MGTGEVTERWYTKDYNGEGDDAEYGYRCRTCGDWFSADTEMNLTQCCPKCGAEDPTMPEINMTPLEIHAVITRLETENAALKRLLRQNNICPYGMLPPGEPMAKCPSGFPGCSCADDAVLDPQTWQEESHAD